MSTFKLTSVRDNVDALLLLPAHRLPVAPATHEEREQMQSLMLEVKAACSAELMSRIRERMFAE